MFEYIYKKLSLFHWNIGFSTTFNANNLSLGEIKWMKHNYRDRFFADPFILDYDDKYITVLVEEFPYATAKGVISKLTIDSNSFELLDKSVLLDLDTHLSFPFIYREDGVIYVIPENSASGKLTLYKLSDDCNSLEPLSILIEDKIVDQIIYKRDGIYYIIAGINGKRENSDIYLYSSDKLNGKFTKMYEDPIKSDISSGRCAGNLIETADQIYRPAQVCANSYGEALTVCRVDSLNPLKEEQIAEYRAEGDYKYGMHTLNQYDSISVVDGLTYLLDPIAKIRLFISLKSLQSIKVHK